MRTTNWLDQLAGLIEMDDTYFGAPKPGKRRHGATGKAKVVVAVETSANKPRLEMVSCVGSDQLPGLSERTLPLINLIWLATAGFQITRLAAGFTVADQ
jgi:hypothetical protein